MKQSARLPFLVLRLPLTAAAPVGADADADGVGVCGAAGEVDDTRRSLTGGQHSFQRLPLQAILRKGYDASWWPAVNLG